MLSIKTIINILLWANQSNMELQNSFEEQDQRSIIKFCYAQELMPVDCHQLLVNTLGQNTLHITTVHRWYQRFMKGNYDIKDHRGAHAVQTHESKDNIAAIKDAFNISRAWSVRSLSAKTEISKSTCYDIITKKLYMKKLNAKWVPRELTDNQKLLRVEYSELNIREYNRQKSRLEHTVAIDETWVYLNRPVEKDQAKEWRTTAENPTQVPQLNRYSQKVIMILAMDIKGICYYEILDENQSVNQQRYLEFLKSLIKKWHRFSKHRVWILDDNARPHRNSIISSWIESRKIERWIHPPYSPDLSPCDYGCFHPLKREIGGKSYNDINSLKIALDYEIREGNKNGKYLAVSKLPERWKRCIQLEGVYL